MKQIVNIPVPPQIPEHIVEEIVVLLPQVIEKTTETVIHRNVCRIAQWSRIPMVLTPQIQEEIVEVIQLIPRE